jgi:four helix bundle protein
VLALRAALIAPARDERGVSLLNIYPFILETITLLQPDVARVARADSDLGRQLRRALASVPLNVAEGFYSQGRNRQARYYTALGSTREVLACFEVAEAMGMIPAPDSQLADRIDRISRTLYRLSRT